MPSLTRNTRNTQSIAQWQSDIYILIQIAGNTYKKIVFVTIRYEQYVYEDAMVNKPLIIHITIRRYTGFDK